MKETNERPRRSVRPRTYVRRRFLAEGGPLPVDEPGSAFLRALSTFDPDLECHWHGPSRRWVLYRVKRREAARGDDLMVKEAIVEGERGEYRPPGFWLIERLRRWDKTRGGSIHPERATRETIERLRQEDRAVDERWDRDVADLCEDVADDMERYAVDARFTRSLKS